MEIESLKSFFNRQGDLRDCTIQHLSLKKTGIDWEKLKLKNTVFLGCELPDEALPVLLKHNTLVFPKVKGLPYNPYRSTLYNPKELVKRKNKEEIDYTIYKHFVKTRFDTPINESLYQTLHDHAIDDALKENIGANSTGEYDRKCVGVMGGHGTGRDESSYQKVVETSWLLCREGYYIVSGGGPGIMEAANFGAYMSEYSWKYVQKAMKTLAKAPHYTDENYRKQADKVKAKYPSKSESLAIPTWFYGHEPSNVFASHIAKYFSNSIREDTLLAITLHGVIYAPGSAGTTQEIFMDAAQNHYVTYGYISPMVFLGKNRYTKKTKLYELIYSLSKGKAYHDYLHLTDEPMDVLKFIKAHPPLSKDLI